MKMPTVRPYRKSRVASVVAAGRKLEWLSMIMAFRTGKSRLNPIPSIKSTKNKGAIAESDLRLDMVKPHKKVLDSITNGFLKQWRFKVFLIKAVYTPF
ncbi:hypothetical protein AYO29_01050 [Coxiella burnetii str. Schperling]|nr:hypothetical protein AYO29_01050 [Coxiella burnetii str. Schperling]